MPPLRLVLVTPETTLLDEPVEKLRFPLYDGQIGILPGRAPLVGRLGYGELLVTTASGERSFFIEGGFCQVKDNVVSILTDRAIPTSAIDAKQAEELLAAASRTIPHTDLEFAARDKNQSRARQMLALARKPR